MSSQQTRNRGEMNELTDEVVAIMLGYKQEFDEQSKAYLWVADRSPNVYYDECPKFTTSLDAIVGELNSLSGDFRTQVFMDIYEDKLDPWNPRVVCKYVMNLLEAK